MRLFLLSVLLVNAVWADFYIINGNEQVRMKELPGGKVDFSVLAQLPVLKKPEKGLYARSDTEAFNHKHLNFRTATINLRQTNVVLTEYSSESEIPGVYDIRFGDVVFDEGVMLQLFYHNRWYGTVIGDPLAILHALFDDTTADPQQAYEAVVAARKAFPDDPRLAGHEKEWKGRVDLARQHARAEQINRTYALYLGTHSPGSKKFYAAQTRSEIESFFREFPESPLMPSLTELLETLK
jgi:hypothetical protein